MSVDVRAIPWGYGHDGIGKGFVRTMKKRIILKRWLCILLAVLLMTGCAGNGYDERKPKSGTNSEVTPNGQKDTPTPASDTPTPTAADTPTPVPDTPTPVPDTPTPVPDTPTPTPIPDTPTPTIAESTPTPTVTKSVPTPTPASWASVEEEQTAFDEFLTEVFVSQMSSADHLTLHFRLEHPEAYGIEVTYGFEEDEYDSERAYQEFKASLTGLDAFTYDHLTDAQKVNYDRLMYELDLTERYRSVDYNCVNNYLMASNNNAVEGIMSALCEYAFVEDKDYADFLKDLEASADYLDVLFKEMKHLCEIGACPSQDMYDTTIDNLNGLCKKNNIILAAFRANAADAGMDAATIEQRAEEVNKIIQEKLIPAAEVMRSNVMTLKEYIEEPKGLAARGAGGQEYYSYLAQASTGSNLALDDMYTYLDKKINGLINTYRSVYLRDMDCINRYSALDYDASDYVTVIDRLKKLTADDFPAIRDTKYTVSALADELCVDGVLAYFLVPQADNPDRKVIRVNPKSKVSNVELYATLAHEGYPGHLYQDEYFRSSEGYHIIDTAFTYTGYGEGWAKLMEREAYRWLTDGDESVMFLCEFESFYSNSVVALCDIGVNYYGWDVKQVQSYLAGTLYGDNPAIAKNVVEFVTSDPAMLLPYTYSFFQCEDIINELMDKGMTRMEAYTAFLNVGPASTCVLRKHLGLPEESK